MKKSTKRKILASVLAIVKVLTPSVTALAFITCDNQAEENTDHLIVRHRSKKITNLFDNNASVTVQGIFNEADLDIAANKIRDAFNYRFFNESYDTQQTTFRAVYTNKQIIIALEKNPTFTQYNATLNGSSFSINYAILDNTDTLKFALHRATQVLGGNTFTPEIVKVIPTVKKMMHM
ncbi:MAG: hypothetical protein FWD24_07115 [Treponema sp.]|nr:hypothetical protein [Treponema sp.]